MAESPLSASKADNPTKIGIKGNIPPVFGIGIILVGALSFNFLIGDKAEIALSLLVFFQ